MEPMSSYKPLKSAETSSQEEPQKQVMPQTIHKVTYAYTQLAKNISFNNNNTCLTALCPGLPG